MTNEAKYHYVIRTSGRDYDYMNFDTDNRAGSKKFREEVRELGKKNGRAYTYYRINKKYEATEWKSI